MKRFLTAGLIGLTGLLAACGAPAGDNDGADAMSGKTVYLVRHAEKLTDTDDPGLTPEGLARADALADYLEDADIDHILSSDYQRTRLTAKPLADRLGLDVVIYDPRDLPAAAETVQALDGNALVVGHSNTTPPLAELLGGKPGAPIVEATEYDRLYRLNWTADGAMTSDILRYGAPSPR